MCQKQGIERKYDERYPYLFFHNFVRRAPKYRYKLQSKEKKRFITEEATPTAAKFSALVKRL